MTFRIADAAGGAPCTPGFAQAVRLFDPARDYSLAEMIEAGLDLDHVDWIVWRKAKADPDALDCVRRWAAALGCEGVDVASSSECAAAIRAVVRERARDLGRGGSSPQAASRLTRKWCRDAMIAAFA